MVSLDYNLIKAFLRPEARLERPRLDLETKSDPVETKAPALRRTSSSYDLSQPDLVNHWSDQWPDSSLVLDQAQIETNHGSTTVERADSYDSLDSEQEIVYSEVTELDRLNWNRAQDFRLKWWQQHQGWLVSGLTDWSTTGQPTGHPIDLITVPDQLCVWLFSGKIPAWQNYRDYLMSRLTQALKFKEANETTYGLPFHLLPLADPNLSLITVRLAQLITTLWCEYLERPDLVKQPDLPAKPTLVKISKQASLIYLPMLSEAASLAVNDDSGFLSQFRQVRADPKIIQGLLASYQQHHITTGGDFYDHVYRLNGYDQLLTDAVFEVVQMAVFAVVLPEE